MYFIPVNPHFSTYLAMREFPDRAHMITMRDPRDFVDWKIEYDLPTLGKFQVLSNWLFEDLLFSRQAVRQADAVFCIGKCLIEKVKQKYQLTTDPRYLPTPVPVPQHVQKAQTPTVCYMARWDRRKRPELFLQLAKEFPDVQFICAGHSRDKKWDSYLRNKYSHLPNLELPGFVDQFSSNTHSNILKKSWIMVNTAIREALPNSFIEASTYGCDIMSAVNPDGFASEFGYHVLDDRFDEGLRKLLDNNKWKEQGERGRRYIQEHFELNRAMDNHMAMYQQLISDCHAVKYSEVCVPSVKV
ncbi:MAG: glycosyltransferase family 4 protein [Nitrospirae bacterium]|nr:glycosyltransferase family 4 protein [Nitrospirota bacterium]